MSVAESWLPEFDHEMNSTRRVLERVPDAELAWQPHAKSMRLGRLASHVTQLVGWGEAVLRQTEVDLAPPDGPAHVAANHASQAELLAAFDRHRAATREALLALADADLATPWSLKAGARTVFTLPRAAAWRTFVLNHTIHHRAQLTVYLRLLGVPVPGLYGPSADEG